MNIVTENQNKDMSKEYQSAEFKLRYPEIFYQFKVRKSVTEPMFAVIKEGSRALKDLKEGDIINMRYYYQDKSMPAELRDTKIKYITKDNTNGFRGHYIIGLDIHPDQDFIVA